MGSKNGFLRRNNIKVMIKPHPYAPGVWIEQTEPSGEEDSYYIFRVKTGTDKLLSVQDILQKVSDHTDMPIETILQKTRKRVNLEPRQVVMYLSKKHTNSSLTEIGQQCGGYDHATVMHACKTIKNLIDTSPSFRQDWLWII